MLVDLGLLIVRIAVGGILFAHGLQKLGYLGGGGVDGTVKMVEGGLGLRPGSFWAWSLIIVELVGGGLIVLGFLGPLGPMLAFADMIVAVVAVHWSRGFFNAKGGYEFSLLVGAGAVAIALLGFGSWSLDAVLGVVVPDWLILAALAVGVVGAVVVLFARNTHAGSAG